MVLKVILSLKDRSNDDIYLIPKFTSIYKNKEGEIIEIIQLNILLNKDLFYIQNLRIYKSKLRLNSSQRSIKGIVLVLS
jgi:hypothetical protein